jgi:hypothetical protein
MTWLQEDDNTGTSVATLLAQIGALSTQCSALLAEVNAHRARCALNAPPDVTHAEATLHGMSVPNPVRSQAYRHLQHVVTRLNKVMVDLGLCRTEMSHGGGA